MDWCKNTFEVVNQLRINTDYSHHRYIAITHDELCPDREDLRDMRDPLPGGWFVAKYKLAKENHHTPYRRGRLEIESGKDVVVEL